MMGIVRALLWSCAMSDAGLLNLRLFLPLLGVGLLLLSPANNHDFTRRVTLTVMIVQFALAAWLTPLDSQVDGLQFETRLPWISRLGRELPDRAGGATTFCSSC